MVPTIFRHFSSFLPLFRISPKSVWVSRNHFDVSLWWKNFPIAQNIYGVYLSVLHFLVLLLCRSTHDFILMQKCPLYQAQSWNEIKISQTSTFASGKLICISQHLRTLTVKGSGWKLTELNWMECGYESCDGCIISGGKKYNSTYIIYESVISLLLTYQC